ncbi:MAG: FAD-binding oxidoreductase [Chitinophagales bacterium]
MKYRRKEFIRLAALGTLSAYLQACTQSSQKPVAVVADSTALKPASESLNKSGVVYIKKGDARYNQLRQGFNQRISKFPAVIALCKDTQQVAEAVKYAKANQLPVAIKSGGHCLEGFSSNNGGMVINLSELNGIEWLQNDEVKLGPGCLLAQIHNELLPKGRIIPAGSCGSVGIGGLTLGGGYGMFSRDYGLTCDSLLEVTMVDGNGDIHNSRDDKDLLWACRGGGSGNFGVITEMKFATHEAPLTMVAHRFRAYKVDAARATAITEKWMEVCANLPAGCFSALVVNGKTLLILLTCYNTKSDLTDIIKQFTALADKPSLGKYQALAAELKVFYGQQNPVYFKNSCGGMYTNFADMKPFIESVYDVIISNPGMIYSIGTLGGAIQRKDFEEASAFPHRAFTFLGELQAYWEDPLKEEHYTTESRKVIDILETNKVNAEYRNYPSLDFKNWQNKYYGNNNYSRLQQVKQKYDPTNLFRFEQSVEAI